MVQAVQRGPLGWSRQLALKEQLDEAVIVAASRPSCSIEKLSSRWSPLTWTTGKIHRSERAVEASASSQIWGFSPARAWFKAQQPYWKLVSLPSQCYGSLERHSQREACQYWTWVIWDGIPRAGGSGRGQEWKLSPVAQIRKHLAPDKSHTLSFSLPLLNMYGCSALN